MAKRAWRPHVTPTAQAALANALLWDVILTAGGNLTVSERMKVPCVRGTFAAAPRQTFRWQLVHRPVVRFRGRYFILVGNPWGEPWQKWCLLLAKPGNPWGDLVVKDGLVQTVRRPGQVLGVNDDIEPVALRVAGADPAAGPVRPAVPGAGPGQDHEQLPGGISGRAQSGDQSELPAEGPT